MNTIILSTYPPKQCGIASFSQDLYQSLAAQGSHAKIAAVSDETVPGAYPKEVQLAINKNTLSDYAMLAEYINKSHFDFCIIQHEYGIYGGADGEYLLTFARQLDKPYLLVAHTVLKGPSAQQHRILKALASQAAGIVGMNRRSLRLLAELYHAPPAKLHFIHHGVPVFPKFDREQLKRGYGWEERPVITTFGLIGPGKGLENGIKAIALLKDKYPQLLYLIAGNTHPVVQRREGDAYYHSLYALAENMGVSQHVHFDKRFIPLEELGIYLNLTDIYMTPYPNYEQAVSGTLAYALGCGRAIVATPYAYALDMLQDKQCGLIAEGSSAESLAKALDAILGNAEMKLSLEQKATLVGQQMSWPRVAQEYIKLSNKILRKTA
jgi:glycosyltransferase involved in cell wall biosynthesis